MERQLFYDELGNPVEFIVRGKFTVDDTDYVALVPAEDLEPVIYILKVAFDEEGQEVLVGIEDDELEIAKDAYEELMREHLQ